MSGNVAGECDITYAVVDKTKKKNRSAPPNIPLKLLIPDSAVYSVVNDIPRHSREGNKDDSYGNIYSNNEMSGSVENSAVYDDNSAPMYSMLDRSVPRASSPERSHPKQQLNSALCYEDKESKKNDLPKTKKCGIMLVCPITLLVAIALFMAAGVALIVVFVRISKLSADIALVQSTSLIESTMADTVNITSLAASVRALESTFVDELNVLNDKLSTNLALSLQSIAANWTRLDNEVNKRLDNISAHISIQRSVINHIISLASLADIFVDETGYAFGSCASIRQFLPSSPSGFYHVRSSFGSAVRVYCDMSRSCGGITGGWMRVTELDMTNSTTQCPSGLQLRRRPRRTCRIRSSDSQLCSSDTFTVSGVEYSKVCGRVKAYQVGSLDAFDNRQSANIETFYVDGVSLTHGTSPRQHIWTFVGARSNFNCPCTNTATSGNIPSFVGKDYFCDTAFISGSIWRFYADNPLWDGAGCEPQSTCCTFNTPPWFYKQLQTTSDDIEMRVCRDQGRANEDIAIEVVEIYVQ